MVGQNNKENTEGGETRGRRIQKEERAKRIQRLDRHTLIRRTCSGKRERREGGYG